MKVNKYNPLGLACIFLSLLMSISCSKEKMPDITGEWKLDNISTVTKGEGSDGELPRTASRRTLQFSARLQTSGCLQDGLRRSGTGWSQAIRCQAQRKLLNNSILRP